MLYRIVVAEFPFRFASRNVASIWEGVQMKRFVAWLHEFFFRRDALFLLAGRVKLYGPSRLPHAPLPNPVAITLTGLYRPSVVAQEKPSQAEPFSQLQSGPKLKAAQ
jgi:hypothetical protein